MANVITTVATNESKGYELFIKPFIENPKVNSLPFTLHVGKVGRDIYLDSPIDVDPTIKTTCGWTWGEGQGIVKKTLNPYELDFSLEQCYTPLLKSIFGDNLPDGWRKGELSNEIIDNIVRKQSNNANTKMLTALFFADTTSTTTWLTGTNGVYAKLVAGALSNDGTVYAGAITDNDLLPANIEATLNTIYNAQSELLMAQEDSQKAFIVTGSIARAWRRYLQIGTGLQNGTPDRASIVNGVSDLSYNGVPMIELSFLDSAIKTYNSTGSPASAIDPHRVILTIPSNHHMILDGTGFEQIDPVYWLKDDKVLSPLSAMIDYTYAFGDLNVIAGF